MGSIGYQVLTAVVMNVVILCHVAPVLMWTRRCCIPEDGNIRYWEVFKTEVVRKREARRMQTSGMCRRVGLL
jgi:hypothetical protein